MAPITHTELYTDFIEYPPFHSKAVSDDSEKTLQLLSAIISSLEEVDTNVENNTVITTELSKKLRFERVFFAMTTLKTDALALNARMLSGIRDCIRDMKKLQEEGVRRVSLGHQFHILHEEMTETAKFLVARKSSTASALAQAHIGDLEQSSYRNDSLREKVSQATKNLQELMAQTEEDQKKWTKKKKSTQTRKRPTRSSVSNSSAKMESSPKKRKMSTVSQDGVLDKVQAKKTGKGSVAEQEELVQPGSSSRKKVTTKKKMSVEKPSLSLQLEKPKRKCKRDANGKVIRIPPILTKAQLWRETYILPLRYEKIGKMSKLRRDKEMLVWLAKPEGMAALAIAAAVEEPPAEEEVMEEEDAADESFIEDKEDDFIDTIEEEVQVINPEKDEDEEEVSKTNEDAKEGGETEKSVGVIQISTKDSNEEGTSVASIEESAAKEKEVIETNEDAKVEEEVKKYPGDEIKLPKGNMEEQVE